MPKYEKNKGELIEVETKEKFKGRIFKDLQMGDQFEEIDQISKKKKLNTIVEKSEVNGFNVLVIEGVSVIE